jgi:hypothetical protein
MPVVVVAIGAGDEDGPPGPYRRGVVVIRRRLRRQAEEVLPSCAGHYGDQHKELHGKEEEEATTRHGSLARCWSERKRETTAMEANCRVARVGGCVNLKTTAAADAN